MATRDYDYLFKIVIVGNSGVGKSSLLLRYADDSFSENYLTTIGVDFKFKTVTVDGKRVKMQIWDTAGQERFRTITSAYYKGADAIVMVYDTTNQSSFNDIDRFWYNEVESFAEKDVDVLLLGNKTDLDSQRQIKTEDVLDYARKKNMEPFEVSAKTSEKVYLAFSTLARKLMVKKDEKNKVKAIQGTQSTVKETTGPVKLDQTPRGGKKLVSQLKNQCC